MRVRHLPDLKACACCRAWCLYEVWHTVREEAVPSKGLRDLVVLTDNLYVGNIYYMLGSISTGKASAAREADQEAILKLFK